jgi:hypothetical protein
MFTKLFLAAFVLKALLVNADPTPSIPGEYMRFTLLGMRTGFDAGCLCLTLMDRPW